jgi:hypothetical protein
MTPSEIIVDQAWRIAERMGRKPRLPPATADYPRGDGTSCVKYINGEYHLTCEERGSVYSEFKTTSADEVLYRIATQIAFAQAVHELPDAPRGNSPLEHIALCESLEVELLARISPEWAARRRLEVKENAVRRAHRLAHGSDPPRS